MKITFLFFIIILQSCVKKETFDEKTLIGYVPIKVVLDKEKPNYKWFYKTKLTFKNDSVYIQKSPVSINDSDTLDSASDCGFYKYAGTWKNIDQFEIDAVEISCDYCPELMEKDSKGNLKKAVRRESYKGNKTNNGLKLNGILYK